MRWLIPLLLLSAPAMALDCGTSAPDWTGRSWFRSEGCSVVNGPVTEVRVGENLWQIVGNVGRHVVPGNVWSNGEWRRDESLDRVIWEGTAKRSSSSCRPGDKPSSGWDFSNGLRVCLFEKRP
jgi:hypothetical protein